MLLMSSLCVCVFLERENDSDSCVVAGNLANFVQDRARGAPLVFVGHLFIILETVQNKELLPQIAFQFIL